MVEKTKYIYLSKDEIVPERFEIFIVKNKSNFTDEILKHKQDIRPVLIKSILSDSFSVYYLFWNDGTNLDELDVAVENDTFEDYQFENAVKTNHQKTTCFECFSIWNTLVIPPGDPYLGNPGLDRKKYLLSTILPCPNCRASLRQSVVKIFYPQVKLKEGDIDPAELFGKKNVEN